MGRSTTGVTTARGFGGRAATRESGETFESLPSCAVGDTSPPESPETQKDPPPPRTAQVSRPIREPTGPHAGSGPVGGAKGYVRSSGAAGFAPGREARH